MLIFAGSASGSLAHSVALGLNLPLNPIHLSRFPDGETFCRIDIPVRHQPVVIIQTTSPPVNDHFMELFLMCDAFKRAGASRLTLVVPYLGYSRQDRLVNGQRVAIGASLIAKLFNALDIDELVCFDLHTEQSLGFFNMSVIHLSGLPLLKAHLMENHPTPGVIVAPDLGGMSRARTLAHTLSGWDLALIDKRGVVTSKIDMIGQVEGKSCLIVDDILDSGQTILTATHTLKEHGALSVAVFCTHALFSRGIDALFAQNALQHIFTTNSVSQRAKLDHHQNVSSFDLSPLIIEALS